MSRECGDCQLCCKLIPVPEIGKLASERCKHQRHGKGCMIYAARPRSCRVWSCKWLLNDDMADMPRPDRCHYVIDVMPDYLTVCDNLTGAKTDWRVEQIWVDQNYPDAHRDPKLRAYLERRAKDGIVGLVRWDNKRGMALIPPSLTDGDKWIEHKEMLDPESQHSPLDVLAKIEAGEL